MELVLLFPGALSLVVIDIYGLILMLIFFVVLTAGFAFELGKKALNIDSRQIENKLSSDVEYNIYYNSIASYIVNTTTILIKEYISKFSILKLIIGFSILKVITLTPGFILYILTVIPDIETVFLISGYLILLLITVIFLGTPWKDNNIPRFFIRLILNSIVIGITIKLVSYGFEPKLFNYYTLTAFTFFTYYNMGDDYFTLMNSDFGTSGPSDTNSGGGNSGPSGGGNSGPNGPNNEGTLIGRGEDSSLNEERYNEKIARVQSGLDAKKWRSFTVGWFKEPPVKYEPRSVVTKFGLLSSIAEDEEIRTKDSEILHNAITKLFRNQWPLDNAKDPVFVEIKEALKKNPKDAFKYKIDNLPKSKRVLENTIKRVDSWALKEAAYRDFSKKITDPWVITSPEVLPPTPRINITDLLNNDRPNNSGPTDPGGPI